MANSRGQLIVREPSWRPPAASPSDFARVHAAKASTHRRWLEFVPGSSGDRELIEINHEGGTAKMGLSGSSSSRSTSR